MAGQTLSYEQYLAAVPPDRRGAVDRVWRVVRENVPAGYVEEIGPGFLTFKADGDWYVAFANQKSYISLHLMPIYVFPELKAKLDESGKKLRGGKSCINFAKAEDLPLETLAEIVGARDPDTYLERVRRARKGDLDRPAD